MVMGGVGRDARDETGALRPRRRYIRSGSDDEDDEENSASDSTSGDGSEDGISEPGEEEMAVLESAMARIQRAQAKDKAQVKLSRAELAALGRHRERETRAQERRQRQKERTDRISVPIEHLETLSRSLTKLPTPSASGDDDSSPQRIPGSFHTEDGQVYPPMGYFPPPNTSSRALPSSSSQPVLGSDDRGGADYRRSDSPFTYSYLRGPSAARHVSDPATTADHVNPFQYMTAGPRAPQYSSGAAAAYRHGSASSADKEAYSRGSAAAPAAVRGRRGPSGHDTGSSEDDDDGTASDDDDEDDEDTDNGRRPPVHNTRSRAKQNLDSGHSRRRSEIVVEIDSDSDPEPEPEPEPERAPERTRSSKTKKPSRSSSSANPKRKSTGASSSSAPNLHSSRRRKGK